MAGNPLPSTSCADPTSPLYGRTEAVIGAIIDKIPGVTACDQVTINHLASITELNFYNLRTLTSLQTGDFAGLSGLEHLRIYYSGLSSLPDGVFGDLTNLKTLEIFGSGSYSPQRQLSNLPAGIFDDLINLEKLSLPYHRLTTLPAGIFDELVNLNSLSLYGNQLTNLPTGIFDRNTRLRELDLSHNHLTSLPDGIFDNLNVRYIRLQGNPLDSFSCADQSSPLYGRTKAVVGAILNNIPGVISCDQVITNHLASINSLAIYGHGSRLTALKSGDFESLINLRSLSLYDNEIHTLPADIFDKLANLETLWLYNNQLTNLPAGVFDPLTNLERLEIHGNRLTSLPAGIFAQLSQLKHLHLENNGLTSLPAGIFEGLANLALESLHLDNNPLPEVSIPVALLQRLETFRRDEGFKLWSPAKRLFHPLLRLACCAGAVLKWPPPY